MKFSAYDTGEIAMNYQEAMKYMEKWELTASFRGWTASGNCAEDWEIRRMN